MVIAGAVTAILLFKPSPKTEPSKTTTQHQPNPQLNQEQDITVEDLTYQKPKGWAKLSKAVLESSAANSGIALPATSSSGTTGPPIASFTVRVVPSIPKDNNDLKNSTLEVLKKLSKFELVSNTDTKVAGKTGQKFAYTYEDKTKMEQELTVVVYNKKTYFILAYADATKFNAQSAEFAKIVGSITFK